VATVTAAVIPKSTTKKLTSSLLPFITILLALPWRGWCLPLRPPTVSERVEDEANPGGRWEPSDRWASVDGNADRDTQVSGNIVKG
jgi:hypothetical protein